MPMPGNFNWRPNSNDSLTNHRYDLEASKWVNSVHKAKSNLPKGSFAGDIGFIGSVIALPLLLILFIIMAPIIFLKEVVGYNVKIFPGDKPTGWRKKFDSGIDWDRINRLKEKGKQQKKKKTTRWEDLTDKQKKLVQYTRAQTAKTKAAGSAK